MNGTVDVELLPKANVAVQAGTIFGTITTDFPLTVRRALVGSWLNGVIGSGGPELKLTTVNGSVHQRAVAPPVTAIDGALRN